MCRVKSLAPGRPGCHFKTAIFNLVLLIGIFTSFKDNALRWMPRDLTDDKSTLVQVMGWCRQATSHYLNQCWHSSMSPYGVTRPQWVQLSCWFYRPCPPPTNGTDYITMVTRAVPARGSPREVRMLWWLLGKMDALYYSTWINGSRYE